MQVAQMHSQTEILFSADSYILKQSSGILKGTKIGYMFAFRFQFVLDLFP